MKKTKQILAIIGAFILVALYLSTLVFALIGSPMATNLLMAAVVCTVLLPVLLYAYILIYRLATKKDENNDSSDK